ncbi:MMPL family transporter [Periweissella cryptocerci]|uniref:MMPL family transporter n=1 Tax=Periweissella cryptocerci TaxID=2506420 RepID=A0A4P6YUB4_9LACO|nr:MMPL family transporter [Periweissella cryptocerci]QBO36293.1 MMPL family transporter [Periweissella cryptocerci]
MKNGKIRWSILGLIWVVILGLVFFTMPSTKQAVSQNQTIKLPASYTTAQAQKIQSDWNSQTKNKHKIQGRQAIVVFNNGNKKLTKIQSDKIAKKVTNLNKQRKQYGIDTIVSAKTSEAAERELVATDGSTQLVQVTLQRNADVGKLNKALNISGLHVYLTGSSILNQTLAQEIRAGLQHTELIAIAIILVMLVLVFKSPIIPLTTLASVGISVAVSKWLVLKMVLAGWIPFSNFTFVLMVVVLYGIGTDYNILLYTNFKKQLETKPLAVAIKQTYRQAGRTMLLSGMAVFVGMASLAFAKFAPYQSVVGVALSILVLLTVLMTLTPAFMGLLGSKLFWPRRELKQKQTNSRVWGTLAKISINRPVATLIVVLGLFGGLALAPKQSVDYNTALEVSDHQPAKQGLMVIKKHYPAGMISPTTIYLASNQRLDTQANLQILDELTSKINHISGVQTVASVTQPYGQPVAELYIGNQLRAVSKNLSQANQGVADLQAGVDQTQTQLKQQDIARQVKAIDKLSDGSAKVAKGTKKVATSLNEANATVKKMAKYLKKHQKDLDEPQYALLSMYLETLQTKLGKDAPTMTDELVDKANALVAPINELSKGAQKVSAGNQELAAKVETLPGEQAKLQDQLDKSKTGLAGLKTGIKSLNGYLAELEKSPAGQTFYVPKTMMRNPKFQPALNNYLAPNRKTAKLLVILTVDASSPQAMKIFDQLQTITKGTLLGTPLAQTKIAMGGGTATTHDLRHISRADMQRTMLIMLIGIGIVLIFATQSLLQPVYILGLLLLIYRLTLVITNWLTSQVLGQTSLTWTTPFLVFVMLLSLGVDYSLFYLKHWHNNGWQLSGLAGGARTIGIVVEAAILILGATFAAMLPAGVMTLSQIALAIMTGLILLGILLPLVLPALLTLTYRKSKINSHEAETRIKD